MSDVAVSVHSKLCGITCCTLLLLHVLYAQFLKNSMDGRSLEIPRGRVGGAEGS